MNNNGSTLIELIIVILGVVEPPKCIDISSNAKISVFNSLSSQLKSTTNLVQMKAKLKGLKAVVTGPDGI